MKSITIYPKDYSDAARVSHEAFQHFLQDKFEEAEFDPELPIGKKYLCDESGRPTGGIKFYQKTEEDIYGEAPAKKKGKKKSKIIEPTEIEKQLLAN